MSLRWERAPAPCALCSKSRNTEAITMRTTEMIDTLDRWSPYALAILRIVTALIYIEHGTQKLFGFPPGLFNALSERDVADSAVKDVFSLSEGKPV